MRLLIDYGASNNLGDLSMLEGAVGRLRELHPSAELAVIDRGFPNMGVWGLPGVSKQPEYLFRPYRATRGKAGAPLSAWRGHWERTVFQLASVCISGVPCARSIRVSPRDVGEGTRRTVGDVCEPFDALHICGGGNLTDTFYWELVRKSILMCTFLEQGKPVVLTGQQVGPFGSMAFRRALSRTLRRIRFVGLRERGSWDFCERAGLDRAHFELMGDDSFGLAPANDALVTSLLARLGLRPGEFLAFNLRLGFYSGGLDQSLDQISAMLEQVASRLRMPILVVPISLNRWDDDIRAGQAVAAKLSSSEVLILREALTPALAKGVLGKAFGAVGVSYHFCTFALSQGVPAVCIFNGEYYAQKARGLADFWEDKRLALALEGSLATTAADSIARALSDRPLRERLSYRAGNAVGEWRSAFDRGSRAALAELAGAFR